MYLKWRCLIGLDSFDKVPQLLNLKIFDFSIFRAFSVGWGRYKIKLIFRRVFSAEKIEPNIGLKQPEGLERSVSDLECFADKIRNINYLQNMGIFRAEENSV
jgi:hypothetical protein